MKSSETCHSWVGRLPQQIADSYFVEDYSSDDQPISAFARDQGTTFYDHDFLEYGWGAASTIKELVADYSYSDQWADELARRVAADKIEGVNFFAFITDAEIEHPKSIDRQNYWLRYMGTITYDIESQLPPNKSLHPNAATASVMES